MYIVHIYIYIIYSTIFVPIIIYKIPTGVHRLRQIFVNSFLKAIPSSAAWYTC